jgi:MFS family permease
MLATIGAEIQTVGLGWEILQRTNSPLALGLVGLVQVAPVLLLALPAGQTADTVPPQWIMVGTQSTMAVVSLGIAVCCGLHAPVPWIYLLLGVGACATAFALPARSSLLPRVVPLDVFANAVSWRTSGWQIAAVAGPALGGVGLALVKSVVPMILISASISAGVAVIVSGIRPRAMAVRREPMRLESLLAGVRFVAADQRILGAITLDLFAVLFGGATALLPIFARDILGVGRVGLGWLRAAPPLGASLMALVMVHRPPFRRPGRVLFAAVAAFGLATIVFGLSRNFFLSFAMLMLTGAFDNISVVIRGTLVQLLTPDAMRGRVAAVNGVFIALSNELGGFESGLTASWWGPVGSVVVGGIGCLGVVVGVSTGWPRLRKIGALTADEMHMPRSDPPAEISPNDRHSP